MVEGGGRWVGHLSLWWVAVPLSSLQLSVGEQWERCWCMLKSAYMYIIWRAIGRGVGAVQNWRVCTRCYVLLRVVGRCVDAVHVLRKVLTSTLLGELDG